MALTPRTLKRTLASAAVAFTLTLGTLVPAVAHDQLVSTEPDTKTALTEAPDEVTMTFSGVLTQVEGGNQVRVVDSAGNDVTNGEVEIQGRTVTQPISGHGTEDETYTVTWRVVSEDGHPVQGRYQLTVGEGKEPVAGETVPAENSESGDTLGQEETGLTATNVALFAGGLAALAVLIVVVFKKRPKN